MRQTYLAWLRILTATNEGYLRYGVVRTAEWYRVGFLFLYFENQKRQWVERADSLVSRNKTQRRERRPLRQHSKY